MNVEKTRIYTQVNRQQNAESGPQGHWPRAIGVTGLGAVCLALRARGERRPGGALGVVGCALAGLGGWRHAARSERACRRSLAAWYSSHLASRAASTDSPRVLACNSESRSQATYSVHTLDKAVAVPWCGPFAATKQRKQETTAELWCTRQVCQAPSKLCAKKTREIIFHRAKTVRASIKLQGKAAHTSYEGHPKVLESKQCTFWGQAMVCKKSQFCTSHHEIFFTQPKPSLES